MVRQESTFSCVVALPKYNSEDPDVGEVDAHKGDTERWKLEQGIP